jgi:hypothetical protein
VHVETESVVVKVSLGLVMVALFGKGTYLTLLLVQKILEAFTFSESSRCLGISFATLGLFGGTRFVVKDAWNTTILGW